MPQCLTNKGLLVNIFRINDPYRMIFLFILFIGTASIRFFNPAIYTLEELNRVVIGEKMATNSLIYADLLDDTGVLPALAYYFIGNVSYFNHSWQLVLGILILCFQAVIFNGITLRYKLLNENTYVPALIYLTLAITFFDSLSLSPEMLSVTFILLAFEYLFRQMASKSKTALNLISMSVFLGLASICYLPALILVILFFIILLIYSSLNYIQILRLFYGIQSVFVLVWIFYFLKDANADLYKVYFLSLFRLEKGAQLSWIEYIYIAGIPSSIAIISIFKVLNSSGFINYQQKVQASLLLYLIAITIILFIWEGRSGAAFNFYLPAFAFFISNFLLLQRKRIWSEAFYVLILAGALYSYLNPLFNLSSQYGSMKTLIVTPTAYENVVNDKEILVIGNKPNIYKNAIPSTKYYQWNLSKKVFEQIGDLKQLQELVTQLTENPPQVIIDEIGVMPNLVERIYFLNNYKREGLTSIYLYNPE